MSLDLKNRKWIPLKPEADVVKQEWDAVKVVIEDIVHVVTQIHPELLSNFVNYGRSFLLRTVRPSVSLLQKSPSSPVSCHATGFYPDRATVFWRKDGEELHEDVDHGEILLNHDGTFQMRVDLNISSVKPEDWRRYDCVFQLYVVEDDIITKLDKAVIRTNCVPPSQVPVGAVVGVVVGLMLLSVCITGLFIWRKKNNNGSRDIRRDVL
ncbi:putative HLA class I histocompatibility antigen, alpha chain H [Channa argus]|uniref:putative HLA class I histocompatibility antigen, alpha chain H n=1 Tax=Channa argus TaxID=215402 RepID=UPI003522A90D